MLGLLRKDFFNLSSQLKIYLFIPLTAIAFCIWQHSFSFTQTMLSILIIFVPLSAFAYDEMSDFNTYALTLPVTKHQIVLSKYVLSAILTVVVIVLAVLIGFIITITPIDLKVQDWKEYFAIIFIMAIMMNFINCILMPLMFRFGTEKARIILMILFFGVGAIGYFLSSQGWIDVSYLNELDISLFCVVAAVIAIVAEAVSMMISNRILDQKEF